MTQIPDYEEFKVLVQRVGEVERENRFLKQLVLAQKWLSRAQVARVIGCSDKTIRRLTIAGKLAYRLEGSKFFYCIDSVRNYCVAQKIDEKVVDERVLASSFLG